MKNPPLIEPTPNEYPEYPMTNPLLVNVSVVPEPAETALLLGAFVLLLAVLRARRVRG